MGPTLLNPGTTVRVARQGDEAQPVAGCFFSIVTTPPQALVPIQRLPHVDGLEPDRIANLIYLSGAEQGGTAFYRQRATGRCAARRSGAGPAEHRRLPIGSGAKRSADAGLTRDDGG